MHGLLRRHARVFVYRVWIQQSGLAMAGVSTKGLLGQQFDFTRSAVGLRFAMGSS
jgi:hypothetical protein